MENIDVLIVGAGNAARSTNLNVVVIEKASYQHEVEIVHSS